MLENCYKSPHTIAAFRASPAGPHLDGFATDLFRQGYRREVLAACLRSAVHLGRWASLQSLPLSAIDEQAISEFEEHLGSCQCPLQRPGIHKHFGARARSFLEYLRTIGIAAPAPSIEPPAESKALVEFRKWMRQHRGAREETVRAYSGVVRNLIDILGEDPLPYSSTTLRNAVLGMAAGHGIKKAQQVATATRMFLRYLALKGGCSPHFVDAVPCAAAWTQTTLPKHLPAEDVQKLIASCEQAQLAGLRDRAILLLLSRLGLRAGDIMALRLAEVDFADASIRVCGKGRREVRLPLPQDVGDAILAYLEHGRPRVPDEHLFLTARAPWRPLGRHGSVSSVVKRAVDRTGVSAPSCGAHLLRHSAATEMLREGASLPYIGAVLRHRNTKTTLKYARVDGRLLGQVAQPWPVEVPPC
jgi:site-specific recombinase XerD